jgi:hypothetical protein
MDDIYKLRRLDILDYVMVNYNFLFKLARPFNVLEYLITFLRFFCRVRGWSEGSFKVDTGGIDEIVVSKVDNNRLLVVIKKGMDAEKLYYVKKSDKFEDKNEECNKEVI